MKPACWHWKKTDGVWFCGYERMTGKRCNFYHDPSLTFGIASGPCVQVSHRTGPCEQKRQPRPSNTTSNCWAVVPKIASDTEPDYEDFPELVAMIAKKKAVKEVLVKADEEHEKKDSEAEEEEEQWKGEEEQWWDDEEHYIY